ncbi:hypothetical protein [Streptomyces luteogriseus]|uniref:hypothetical protein n=1 Tax=Streptomyces luteogriseus TaxID=68233 RepID=UPI0037BCF471
MTVAHGHREAAQAIENVLYHDNVTRVDITPKGHEPEAAPAKTVKAQKIEWREEAHPRGELWAGFIGERKVADVFASVDNVKPNYTMYLGGGDDEEYIQCSSVESGKRAAQRVLNKFVQDLVGG